MAKVELTPQEQTLFKKAQLNNLDLTEEEFLIMRKKALQKSTTGNVRKVLVRGVVITGDFPAEELAYMASLEREDDDNK